MNGEGGMNGEGMEQEERGRRRNMVHKWRKEEHTCVLVDCFYKGVHVDVHTYSSTMNGTGVV